MANHAFAHLHGSVRGFSLMAIFVLCISSMFADAKKEEPPKPAQSIAELQQQIEKILKDSHTPGVSLAIVRMDGPEWVAGLGTADVAANKPNTPDTLFRIGSTSKAFTGLAILKLVNEGKLSLDDPVRKVAPEVAFENQWEATDPVRVVDLLEHTTGWDDMHLKEYAMNDPALSLKDALEYGKGSRVSRWRPGTRMSYCNSGPAVAAFIVEKISGKTIEQYVSENFFVPVGMNTATYMQPAPNVPATTLYHADGKTPFPYWHVMYRPAGSINASAKDMAAYLSFYLHRGNVNGVEVMPAASIDRMEVPVRVWSAREGTKGGYGIYNYEGVRKGYIYHGHNGGVEGGLTNMAYMPENGVGFFFSINSGNDEAFEKISDAITAYVTRDIKRPVPPAAAPLPSNAESFSGWYRTGSPRNEMTAFLDKLASLSHVRFADGKMYVSNLDERDDPYVPVEGLLLRNTPKPKKSGEQEPEEPVATLALVPANADGQFIQFGGGTVTMERVPGWLAIAEILMTLWVVLAGVAILAYAPFWIIGGLFKSRRRPAERAMRVWPLVAMLSLFALVGIFATVSEEVIEKLGHPTGWAYLLTGTTRLFAVASLMSVWSVWRAKPEDVRSRVRNFSAFVALGLLIATIYLALWGVIGFRTWA